MEHPLSRYRKDNSVTLQRLAELLGTGRATIWKWERSGIPAGRVRDVERVTGVSRVILRPDLFGPSDPPSGGSLFCPPDTSLPPVEPRFDGDNGEGLSSQERQR